MMNGQGIDVQRATQTADPLSGMRCRTHIGINDGEPMAHAWDGATDQLGLVTGQSDEAHPTEIWHQFTKGHIPVPLPPLLGAQDRLRPGTASGTTSTDNTGGIV